MTKRIIAIGFIFVCTTIAWAILGATIFARTQQSDQSLRGRVASTWGTRQTQAAPAPTGVRMQRRQVERREQDRVTQQTVEELVGVPLPIERTRATVDLDLEHRQKGLLWYSTYAVRFAGTYTIRNVALSDSVTVRIPYPAERAIYDDLTVSLDGAPVPVVTAGDAFTATVRIPPGDTATLAFGYRSQGLERWSYDFGGEMSQVRDFELTMRTDFRDIDFADNTLSATVKRETPDGWELTWRYANLLSGYDIGLVMPERLQPGPVAGRISLFAPVTLFFFFLLMFLITTIRGVELHPMNYFFLAAAFFAFHLLLAYLVDHISIHLAFAIAALTSVGLVVSYLRLVVGTRFAVREAAIAQVVYLVLFSYAFFFDGFTGLAITIGSVLTLFTVMQMTGRVRWSEKFARA